MKTIIISFLLLLPASLSAQFTVEMQVEVDLALQTDSVVIGTIPPFCIAEYCVIIVDTTVANVNVFSLTARQSQTDLLTYNFVAEQDIIGSVHAQESDTPTGESNETIVLHYTTLGGDEASGRVRVFIRYIQMY